MTRKRKSSKETSKKKSSGFFRKVLISLFFILIIIGGGTVYFTYTAVYKPNIKLQGKENTFLYINTGSTFNEVLKTLVDSQIINNQSSFKWVAEHKGYINKVKPGRYKIKKGMSNNELVNLLRSGVQEPVKLIFNEARTKNDFTEIISKQIEAEKISIEKLLEDNDFLNQYQVNNKNVLTLFIPNTYDFFWNTNAQQFIERMAEENNKFWTKERLKKAARLNLSKTEVSILASIVQQESKVVDEQPVVAGVYLNRLKKKMLLQADPTVIFAVGDFSIRRVLNTHLNYDSPYNTYKYLGLPPGPICMPYSNTIDAVLNSKPHNYLYFCAKADFSGRHSFASTLAQHNRNAEAFRKALNNKKIFK